MRFRETCREFILLSEVQHDAAEVVKDRCDVNHREVAQFLLTKWHASGRSFYADIGLFHNHFRWTTRCIASSPSTGSTTRAPLRRAPCMPIHVCQCTRCPISSLRRCARHHPSE